MTLGLPRLLAACAGLCAFGSLAISAPLAQDTPAAETPADVRPSGSADIAPPIDKHVTLTGEESALFYKFARIERDVDLAYRALYAGDEAGAGRLFDGIASGLGAIHREYLLDARKDPLVRSSNLARATHAEQESGETWYPLSDHLVYWMSFLPRRYLQDIDDRTGVEAKAALRSAADRDDDLELRRVARVYAYTKAGVQALDRVVIASFEGGRFLDCVAWLMQFRETRPWLYNDDPMRHLRLLLSLDRLGEFEILEEELELARHAFARQDLRVAGDTLPFLDAFERLRGAFAVNATSGAPRRAGKLLAPLVFPLATGLEMKQAGAATKVLVEPLLYGSTLVLPRSDDTLFWYPALKPGIARWLELSSAERNVFRGEEENPRRQPWMRFESGAVAAPGSRLRTAAMTSQFVAADSLAGAAGMHDILAAVLGTGSGQKGGETGNQIQLFDMTREGALLATLPLEASLVDEPELVASLGRTHFGGRPVLHEGRLYIAGSVALESSTEMHVHCFDVALASESFGELLWREKIAAVQGRFRAWGGGGFAELIDAATITASGTRLFISTNCGAVACLDSRDGAAYWIVKYARAGRWRQDGWNDYEAMDSAAFPAAITLAGASAVASPSDGQTGLSISAYSGKVLTPLLRFKQAYKSAVFHLGVSNGYAYYQTADVLEAEPITFDGRVRNGDGSIGYGKPLKAKDIPAELRAQIDGTARGLIAGDEVLLPCQRGLLRFELGTLAYKSFERWPDLPEEMPDDDKAGAKNAKKLDEIALGDTRGAGLMSLAWLPKGNGPDGRAALMLTGQREAKLYPLDDAR